MQFLVFILSIGILISNLKLSHLEKERSASELPYAETNVDLIRRSRSIEIEDLHSEESIAVQNDVDGEFLLSHLQLMKNHFYLFKKSIDSSYQNSDVAKQVIREEKSAMNAVSP